jgi:hypothetical protein
MAIIQGLQAAWGAIQRILAAIDRFVAFLKAVRGGNAGPAFAQALAAAAVAVIEFVSQFLLRKIAGAAKKVAGKIKAIAQRIGQRLMGVARKVGGALKRGAAKVRRGAAKLRDKVLGKRKKTPEDKRKEKQDRLDKAVRELTPKVQALIDRGVGKLRLKAQLAFWKVRYRLSSLTVVTSGRTATVRAKVNPEADLIRNVIITTGDLLHEQVDKVWPIVIKHPKVQDALKKIRAQRAESFEDKSDEQGKKGRQTTGPYHRTEVEDPGVPGAAQADVLTGSKVGDKDRPPHTIETRKFPDAEGETAATTSERQESRGPGGIIVTGGGRYHERLDELGALTPVESKTFGEALLAMQSRQPLPPGVDPKQVAEFARLHEVEAGRDPGAFVTIQMLAQLMAQGKVTAKEALLQHQMSDIGAMDISRRAEEQRQRQRRAAEARERGEEPAKGDLKDPWRGPRKFKQGEEKLEEPWEDATSRFWDREKRAVVLWLETRMLLDPYFFASEERFANLLRKELPEYLADHIIKGTMLEIPSRKPTITTEPPAAPGIPGAAAAETLGE